MATKKNNIGKKKVDVISLDNKPVNPEVQKEPVNIPNKFVKIAELIEHTKTINLSGGRVYKDLGNGYGMYSDNGQVFRLK